MGVDDIGWNFPSNNDGREDGLHDPGIETFRDNPLRAVAREGTQNAADAAEAGSGKPVEIHFSVVELPVDAVPGHQELRRVLDSCRAYWKSNAATAKFTKGALKLLANDTVRALKISDYNTTGLRGPFGERTSDWFKLTKAVGASDKATGAGGSFGIGKHAPFACSDLRTVLYCTRDVDQQFAFQGVSKLVTHTSGRKKVTTQGTGYFGVRDRNQPITDARRVDARFRRSKSEVGTDLWVLGFRRDKDWEDEIARGLIESFFVSIHEGRLIAHVGGTVLNKNSLPTLIERYANQDEHWAPRAYYEALVSEEAAFFYEDDFEGYGRVELRILANKAFPKKVAMVRTSGMLVAVRSRFQTPVKFAGVFQAKGEALNTLLKSLEPPSHDKWEAKRGEDPREAQRVLNALTRWVTDKVRTLAGDGGDDELDVEAVSQYLPDDDAADAEAGPDGSGEGERAEPAADILVHLRQYEPRHGRATVLGEEEVVEDGDDVPVRPTTPPDPPEPPGPPTPPRPPRPAPELETDPVPDEAGPDRGGTPAPRPSVVPITLRKVRVFCSDPAVGRYRVLAEPETSGEGYFVVHVVGEVGQEPAPIQEFRVDGEGEARAPGRRGAVGPLPLTAGRRVAVDIVLEGALHCALEVTAHAA